MTSKIGRRSVCIWIGLILLFFSPSLAAAVAPQLKLLGKLGKPLNRIAGLTLDNAGNLFLADSGRQVIVKYDKYGRKLKSFFVQSVGEGGIAVSPMGDFLYLASERQVLILNGDNGVVVVRLLPRSGAFQQVVALAADARGNLWVADGEAGTVSSFDPQGNYLIELVASYGMERFGKLRLLAVNRAKEEIWVVDEGEGVAKVLVFDLDGGLRRELSAQSDFGPEPIGRFSALAFDPQGRIYILDAAKKEIRGFDSKTMQVTSFHGSGFPTKKPLQGKGGIAFDPVASRLFVGYGVEVFILGVDSRKSLQPLVW